MGIKQVKIIILYGLKYLGLFRLMRRRTRRKLRILCYHGIAFQDEHRFLPVLFMSEDTFRHRMNLLSNLGYPVISLDQAVRGLTTDDLPDEAVVITFDDGWRGTFSKALPILQHHHFPVSVYITSYYVEKRLPVLNVMLQYILWKSDLGHLNLEHLGMTDVSGTVDLNNFAERQDACQKILSYLEATHPVGERFQAFRKICEIVKVDWDRLEANGMFWLATPETIGEAAALDGVDMELHTHRHLFPDRSYEDCVQEIVENQQWLSQWTGKKATHFCYPSGWYEEKQIKWLEKMGVKSATTVSPGLNDSDKSLWQLDRFLDGENVSDIEFEAELCGISDVIRKITRR